MGFIKNVMTSEKNHKIMKKIKIYIVNKTKNHFSKILF